MVRLRPSAPDTPAAPQRGDDSPAQPTDWRGQGRHSEFFLERREINRAATAAIPPSFRHEVVTKVLLREKVKMLWTWGMRTMIFSLGHERLWSNDIAARVGRILKTLPLPTTTTVRIVRTLDWDCVDAIVDCDQIIVVDALDSGQEPGTCFIEEVLQDDAPTFRLYCRHRDLVKDIVALAHLVGMEGSPKRVVIVGVETGGARWDESSDATTARSAVSLAVDSVLRSFGADVALRRMVPNACLRIEYAEMNDFGSELSSQGAA